MSDIRRRRLVRAAKLMGLAAVAIVALVLYQSVFDRPDTAKPTPAVRFALANLAEGQTAQLSWGDRPVLVTHRTAAMLNGLGEVEAALLDADSANSQQPNSMRNRLRSLRREWFVAIARGTGIGCPLEVLKAADRVGVTPWFGGYRDRCDGSLYDPAGRVYRDQSAATNLIVPPYHFASGGQLIIGTEE